MTTTLYRFYAKNGDLLYVGIAKNPILRMQQHRKDKPWWTEIASSTYQHFGSRGAAAQAETAAIKYELPRCNIAGISQPRGMVGLHTVTVEDPDWIRLERLDSRLRGLREAVQAYDPWQSPHTCSEVFWHQEIRQPLHSIVGWYRSFPERDENDRYLSSQEAWEIAISALGYELEDCATACDLRGHMEPA